MKRDLRGSLAAKCVAIFLLILTTAGAVGGYAIVLMQSYGYGTAGSFQEDQLCLDEMVQAERVALDKTVEPDYYSGYELNNFYPDFSALIYDGEPDSENLAGSWSEVPENILCEHTNQFRDGRAESGYYTVIGYLSSPMQSRSNFYRNFSVYHFMRSFDYAGTAAMTAFLALISLGLLVFLLCAAGHRAGRTGVFPNFMDKIPLDLYLFCAVPLFVFCLLMPDQFGRWNAHIPLLFYLAPWVLCLLCAAAVALATLLTVSTRLKLGKWWRNTICYGVLRWCRKMWRRFWWTVLEFVRILPMTWRVVLAVGGILVVQTFLTLLIFETYDQAVFFLFTLVLDAALVVGSAWLTRQLQLVQDMGKALAAGDLDAKLDTGKLFWDIKSHAECLNAIGVGMNEAVERRMRSERLKTELITNVSHDIKTPLTSIVNYVDLLKKEELPPAAAEYVTVLNRQSHRLKKLTEDLVEASKASTGNVAVHLEPIVVNEIIHQAVGDYDERLAAGKLEVVVSTYEGNLIAMTDGRLLWRVLDNLLSNVCKYAMAGTRVYVDLGARDGWILLTMKNISRDPLNINADELMERFVRGDASRHTEGSGLGLNIARSLMDLMGGAFSLSVDGDLFKAELTLKMVEQKPWEKPVELRLVTGAERTKNA